MPQARQLWPSLARIAATIAIFVFHYLGLQGRYQYQLDTYGLLVFCFLSGYLAHLGPETPRTPWMIRRAAAILIPYWLVIIPVFVINHFVHYKPVTTASAIVSILGGSFFVTNPLYVLSWYITFVLMLYAYAVLEPVRLGFRIVYMVLGILVFSYLLHRQWFFIAFLGGLRLADWRRIRGWRSRNTSGRLAEVLFTIQKYCYPFFLVHGAVLLFFVHKTAVSGWQLFVFAFLLSALLSLVLDRIAKPLQALVLARIPVTAERH